QIGEDRQNAGHFYGARDHETERSVEEEVPLLDRQAYVTRFPGIFGAELKFSAAEEQERSDDRKQRRHDGDVPPSHPAEGLSAQSPAHMLRSVGSVRQQEQRGRRRQRERDPDESLL